MVSARHIELATIAVAFCAVVASNFVPLAHSTFMQIVELLCAIALIISILAQFRKSRLRAWLSYCTKIGLLCFVVSLLLGNFTTFSYKTVIVKELATDVAVNEAQKWVQLPFSLSLADVVEECYPSGNPKRVSATLQVTDNQSVTTLTCAPNQPARYNGYDLYLEGYGPSDAHILLVRQPLKWLVWLGIALVAISAFGAIFHLQKKGETDV